MKTALVSGSSRGIGRAIAVELARAGYRVCVTGRNASEVEATAAAIQGEPFVGDLTDEKQISKCVDEAVARCGRLDVIVANLGSGRSIPDAIVPLEEMRRVFELNYFSAVQLCNCAIPHLPPSGNIVLIGSIAGCEALRAPIAYSAAKAALLAYMKSLSLLLAPIRVNAVSPGNVLFPGGTWDKKLQEDEAKVREYVSKNVPLDRFAEPHEIAQAVSFVLQSEFMTGHNLIVDGGQTRKP